MNLTGLGRWLMRQITGDDGKSNDPMTISQALCYAPVYHCVDRITGAFGVMPLNILRYGSDRREKTIQERHPSYKLLRWRPNAYQIPSTFKKQMMVHALMVGNGRAYIHRVNGIATELIPLLPDRTGTMLIKGEKLHATIVERDDRIGLWEDMANNPEKVIYMNDGEVLHVPGFSYDGICGVSLLEMARRSWGVGLGAEQSLAKQQKKGYGGGLMLEAPAGAFRNEGDAKEFLKNFREVHEGSENQGKIGMLREGIKANVIQMNNTDAQFLEMRKFQREEVALQFCLEGILGDSSNASYNSLAEKNLAYRVNCLSKWTIVWEEECDLKLLSESERARGFYHKYNDGALLRTEKSATMTFCVQGRAAKILSANECREMFDLNPYEGGDEYENPNTGGADNMSDDPEKGNGGESGGERDDSETKATARMLAKLMRIESQRCKDHAKSAYVKYSQTPIKTRATKDRYANEFKQWMDGFYSDWQCKLADEIEAVGGDRELATTHCEESKRRLLEACECQPEQLADSISKCVSTWEGRVNALLEGLQK